MIADPFATWLPEVIADEVTICADAINHEALQNMWTFTLTREQATRITPTDVEDFLRAVIISRRNWLRGRHVLPGQMRFYCWFDEQAGQLRFSMVSACHRRLPFACQVVDAAEVSHVVRRFLQAVAGGLIPRSALCEISHAEDQQPQDPTAGLLPVWSTPLP